MAPTQQTRSHALALHPGISNSSKKVTSKNSEKITKTVVHPQKSPQKASEEAQTPVSQLSELQTRLLALGRFRLPTTPTTKNITESQPDVFTFFPKLPIELRVQIWRLAIPSRLVFFKPGTLCTFWDTWDTSLPNFDRTQRIVDLVHVNREARAEVLEYSNQYKVSEPISRGLCSLKLLHFNSELDTVYISQPADLQALVDNFDLEAVHHLAISPGVLAVRNGRSGYTVGIKEWNLASELILFKGLRTLTLNTHANAAMFNLDRQYMDHFAEVCNRAKKMRPEWRMPELILGEEMGPWW